MCQAGTNGSAPASDSRQLFLAAWVSCELVTLFITRCGVALLLRSSRLPQVPFPVPCLHPCHIAMPSPICGRACWGVSMSIVELLARRYAQRPCVCSSIFVVWYMYALLYSLCH